MENLTIQEFNRLNCPIFKSIVEVGDYWYLLLIRESFLGTRRFDEYQKILGISKSVLTKKINGLVEKGILRKVEYKPENQRRRYEYKLTEKGFDFYNVILALIEWGNKYLVDKTGDRARIVKRNSEEELKLAVADSSNDLVDRANLKIQFYRN